MGSVLSRSGVFLFGIPPLGTAHTALVVVVVDALLGVGFLALTVALRGFHLH